VATYRPTAEMVRVAGDQLAKSFELRTVRQIRRALDKAAAGSPQALRWGGDAGKRWATQIVERADAELRVQKAIDVYGEASWRHFCFAHIAPEQARPELLRKAQVYASNAERIAEQGTTLGMDLRKAPKLAGRMRWRGLDLSIETAVGDVRQWYDPHNDEHGTTVMQYAYGYIRGTEGADGEHTDVYVGPMLEEADEVYIIHQNKAPDFTRYDEDKVMLGFPSADAAKAAYLRQYNDARFYGGMSAMSADDFVARCATGCVRGKLAHKSMGSEIRAAWSSWRRRQ